MDWQVEAQLLSWCTLSYKAGSSCVLSLHQLVAVLEDEHVEFKIDPSMYKPVCGKSQDLHGHA